MFALKSFVLLILNHELQYSQAHKNIVERKSVLCLMKVGGMTMKYYVVDAFAEKTFEGNPAGVCVLEKWIPDNLMQNITSENNLSETAFTVKEANGYFLRWFTPGGEIDLCGHATLGTAYILFRFFEPGANEITFQTKSGQLTVTRKDDLLEMDFPAYALSQIDVTDEMTDAIGIRPIEAWRGRDLICILENEEQVYSICPNQEKILNLDGLLFHITAQGKQYDCVSRTFAPKMGVAEDAVCGSGHCHIVPLWADKQKKDKIVARQASKRGGTLHCLQEGSRIKLAGSAVLYSAAELYVENLCPGGFVSEHCNK